MTFTQFIRLLYRNLILLILIPSVLALSIWHFTKKEPKVFSSETVIYTGIASGYSLNGDNRGDYFSTSNAFDNLLTLINSRQTREEVSITLLSTHLFNDKHDPSVLGWDAYKQLKQLIPENIRRELVKPTLDETREAITNYMKGNDNNAVYALLNSANPYYSYNALSNIQPIRINSSDLIKISYETNDAAICKHTLEILADVFMKKHLFLRESQTGSVIAYFEKEVKASYRRLDSCERLFLDFNRNNDIINYYEQTKAVAGERENLYALNHNLEMDRSAEEKAVERINQDLKGKVYQTTYGGEIIKQREKLANVYNQISMTEVMGKGMGDNSQRSYLDSLKRTSTSLEKNLEASVQKLATLYNTPNGIPVKSVLDEWVKKSINYEQSKARLTVMDKRKQEFDQEYKKLAPLGAILKKIERQIAVAEQEYLELLHGLNIARLSQQNNQLSAKLTIVDPPFLPLKPNASKRMILIAVGFIAGFIVILAVIVGNYLLSSTLKDGISAARKVGAPLLGIYPHFKEKKAFLNKANFRIMQQLVSKIKFNKKPVVIGVVSTQKTEGKSALIEVWQEELAKMNFNVKRQEWKEGEAITTDSKTQIVFLEFPALDSTIINASKLPKLDHTLLVLKTNRIWNRIDNEVLDSFSNATGISPLLVLNGVQSEVAEEYVGKKQSKTKYWSVMRERMSNFYSGGDLNFQ